MTSGDGGQPTAAQLLGVAVEVVRAAAEQAGRLRREGVEAVATKSTDTDIVTAADRAVERQVADELRRLRPGDAVLGEEFGEESDEQGGDHDRERGPGGDSARAPVRWLLDPIDGTVNYLYGVPWYAVSLAAERDGAVVAGVVCNVATGAQWTAAVGEGAWRDGRRLGGSAQRELRQALVATGFGYAAPRRAHQARVVAELITEVRDIRRLGAASLDLCLAAEGVVDAYYEKGLSLWDYAAGALVAAEAGLTVGGLHGAAASGEMLVAAPPALFAPLHDRLAALDAAGGP